VEGIERRLDEANHDSVREVKPAEVPDESKIPKEFLERESCPYYPDPDVDLAERFKFDKRLRKLPVDSEGKWIRRHKNWKPEDVPEWMWAEADAEDKENIRRVMLEQNPRNRSKVPVKDLEEYDKIAERALRGEIVDARGRSGGDGV